MTYMPIFVLVVFGILGDVEGIPLPLKRTRGSPRRIIIAPPLKKRKKKTPKKNIEVTRFSHRLIIREEVYKTESYYLKSVFILERFLKSLIHAGMTGVVISRASPDVEIATAALFVLHKTTDQQLTV